MAGSGLEQMLPPALASFAVVVVPLLSRAERDASPNNPTSKALSLTGGVLIIWLASLGAEAAAQASGYSFWVIVVPFAVAMLAVNVGAVYYRSGSHIWRFYYVLTLGLVSAAFSAYTAGRGLIVLRADSQKELHVKYREITGETPITPTRAWGQFIVVFPEESFNKVAEIQTTGDSSIDLDAEELKRRTRGRWGTKWISLSNDSDSP